MKKQKISAFLAILISVTLISGCEKQIIESTISDTYVNNSDDASEYTADTLQNQYSTTQELTENEVTDVNIENEDIIIPEKFYYYSYSETPGVEKLLNNNIIDKLYIKECDNAVTTVEVMDVYNRYLDIWENEMDIVADKIKASLSDEILQNFIESQEAWQIYFETNPNIAVDVYTQKMGAGSIIHYLYGDKALQMVRNRTLELAEYCYILTGNFEFDFNEEKS